MKFEFRFLDKICSLSAYTTLEVEPVQVSVEADNSINFSSLQSIVPAAHGLYWKDNGQKRALESVFHTFSIGTKRIMQSIFVDDNLIILHFYFYIKIILSRYYQNTSFSPFHIIVLMVELWKLD